MTVFFYTIRSAALNDSITADTHSIAATSKKLPIISSDRLPREPTDWIYPHMELGEGFP